MKKQQGAALVLALMLLLVISVIGVATIRTASMQAKMTASSYQHDIALMAAEGALRFAEDQILVTNEAAFQANTGGLYTERAVGVDQPYQTVDWDAGYNHAASNNVYVSKNVSIQNGATSKYIITQLTPLTLQSSTMRFYRITAQGYDKGGDSVVTLQSIFAKEL